MSKTRRRQDARSDAMLLACERAENKVLQERLHETRMIAERQRTEMNGAITRAQAEIGRLKLEISDAIAARDRYRTELRSLAEAFRFMYRGVLSALEASDTP